MQPRLTHATTRRAATAATVTVALSTAAAALVLSGLPTLSVGSDANSANNPFIQSPDPALSGGGRDQTLKFGDVLRGDTGASLDDVLLGRLGVDVLFGGLGDDVLVGGSEHFNPENRDRAFGEAGNDVFLWSPGDGNDFFDGGEGIDTVVFGLLGELEAGQLVFRVATDQLAGDVFIDPLDGLPRMNVSGSPGFCEVIDASSSATAAAELAALDVEHLVKFFLRGVNNAFLTGQQATDNGLRVTLYLRDVEVLVCTSPSGGVMEAFNLTVSPPQPLPIQSVLGRLPKLAQMLQ